MKKTVKIIAFVAAAMAVIACSKTTANQMLELADQVKVETTPAVLTLVGDKVPVEISITYPKGWFHKDAMLVVTPVLIYEGGQQTGESHIYQGVNIRDNHKVVKPEGGTVKEKMEFIYVDGMQKSYLEIRSVAVYGGRKVDLPTVKAADGCLTTSLLADKGGEFEYKADAYQEVVEQTAEGQILYDVNSSAVSGRQLNSSSIRDFKAALKEMQESDRVTIKNTKIISYASPEGGEQLNAKLSEDRSSSAMKAWSSISGGVKAGQPEVQSVGQDWEGFQEAVSKSNILDKDLILRVLSMYSDPAVRESEIKNMSQIYTEIKDEVFPELRRSRFVTSMEYRNYSESDLKKLAEKRLFMLDEEGILRVAAITPDLEKKSQFYRMAAERFNSERGFFNLAVVALESGKPAVAEAYLDKLEKEDDPDVLNARGVIALRRGKIDKAVECFEKSGTSSAKKNLGTVKILKGDYAGAAEALKGTDSVNEGLALILADRLDEAVEVLKGEDSRTLYLKAIVCARKGDKAGMKENLAFACAKDPALRERAVKDIEFAAFEI